MTDRLAIEELSVRFASEDGPVYAVDDLSVRVGEREVLAIVGESGCGKSVTAATVLGLLPETAQVTSGRILLDGDDLLALRPARLRSLRGNQIGMVFQEPMTSLNPVFTIGRQVREVLQRHLGYNRSRAQETAVELLDRVRIAEPERRVGEYPHQLSGGMRQRVMIAMAVACNPSVLIADEPTTALDVTIQAGILDIVRHLRADLGTSVVLITHDLGVVADIADSVAIMYAGRKIEQAPITELFANPQHPYTAGLLGAVPRPGALAHSDAPRRLAEIPGRVPVLSAPASSCVFAPRCVRSDEVCTSERPDLVTLAPSHLGACHHPGGPHEQARPALGDLVERTRPDPPAAHDAAPVLEVIDLVKHFPVRKGLGEGSEVVRAVDGVSLSIGRGEVLGLVGESGSGKSTTAQCIMRLLDPTSGTILLDGTDITHLNRKAMRPLRRDVHMVFQDPYSSLDPRMTCGQIVDEPLRQHRLGNRAERRARIDELFERCGLSPETRSRHPHELSGGQRQRVGIARALAVEPKLLIADEPISALDVSVQAAIVNLLLELQEDMGFSCLFVAHDLAAVEFVSDRIAVMYLGKVVELADRRALFDSPKMPYTQALLSAVPLPDPPAQRARERVVLEGEIPSPIAPPSGCAFRTRCPVAEDRCAEEAPPLVDVAGTGHHAACHLIAADGTPPDIVAGASS